LDADMSGKVSQAEWLAYIKRLADKSEKAAAKVLRLSEEQIVASNFPLKSEALRIFQMADRNQDGELNMSELAELRGRPEWAEAMMGNVDSDTSGKVSQAEWLAYVKKLADKNEKSAAAVLSLYKKQIAKNGSER